MRLMLAIILAIMLAIILAIMLVNSQERKIKTLFLISNGIFLDILCELI